MTDDDEEAAYVGEGGQIARGRKNFGRKGDDVWGDFLFVLFFFSHFIVLAEESTISTFLLFELEI